MSVLAYDEGGIVDLDQSAGSVGMRWGIVAVVVLCFSAVVRTHPHCRLLL